MQEAVEIGLCTCTWWRLRTWSSKFRSRANAETSHSVRTGPVVVIGVEGSGEKFSDGEILKTTTVGSLQTTTTTLFSYSGHLYNPTWMRGIRYHPLSPSRKHRRPYINEQANANERMSKYTAPPNPQGNRPRSIQSLAALLPYWLAAGS
jgi:hypothetical protein